MRLALFASGGGTNVQSILDAIDRGDVPAIPALCISNTPDAGALDRAARHNVPTAILPPDDYASPTAFGAALLDVLSEHNVTFIALAGYLRKIPPNVVAAYEERMTNIHPALLPAFGGRGMYGMNVHRAVVASGVHWTGATVHLVNNAYDQGPIVLQEPVPVYADDSPDDVAARVLAVEHRIYPTALRLFATDRIRVDGRRVRIV